LKILKLSIIGLLINVIPIFAISSNIELPDYELVKKDFINGQINSDRINQIILKDPRLVPKSRGGLKNDVDASSDGLGVLVIGKLNNGRVGGLILSNDNDIIHNNLNYLIEEYGKKAKEEGKSVINYVKENIINGNISGDEASTIKDKLSRNDIASVSVSHSYNFYNVKKGDTVDLTVNISGNENNSEVEYKWSGISNSNIIKNGDNIFSLLIPYKEGIYNIELTVIDPDGNGETKLDSFQVKAVEASDFSGVPLTHRIWDIMPGGKYFNEPFVQLGHTYDKYGLAKDSTTGGWKSIDGTKVYIGKPIGENGASTYVRLNDFPINYYVETVNPIRVTSGCYKSGGISILGTPSSYEVDSTSLLKIDLAGISSLPCYTKCPENTIPFAIEHPTMISHGLICISTPKENMCPNGGTIQNDRYNNLSWYYCADKKLSDNPTNKIQ
jgi:hypothetical protein